jgi:hypothetical protein
MGGSKVHTKYDLPKCHTLSQLLKWINVDDSEGFLLSELEHDELCMSFLDDALARDKRDKCLCD